MSAEVVSDFSTVATLVDDAVVRAVRWEALPNALVLDLDCPLETTHGPDGAFVRMCRGWLVVEDAQGFSVHIDWGGFRNGFSIMDIERSSSEGSFAATEYRFLTDFPEGSLRVTGRRLVLVRSTKTHRGRDAALPSDVRAFLASDAELSSAYGKAQQDARAHKR